MNDNPMITIAIPTYNNNLGLLRQLEILLPQLSGRNAKVLIIDNHSPDPVQQYLGSRIYLPEFVSICRNSLNIGADRNIQLCVRRAETKWVWTLSDNDLLKSDAVDQVFGVIQRHPNCVFFVLNGKEEKEVCGVREFCRSVLYGSSFFCSLNVFNKNYFDNYEGYYTEHLDTQQSPLLTTLKILADDPNATCAIGKVDLFRNCEPAKWSKSAFVLATCKVFSVLRKDHQNDIEVIANSLGLQITSVQIGHLLSARAFEGVGFWKYLYLGYQVYKSAHAKKFSFKQILLFALVLIYPAWYRAKRRQQVR